MLSVEANITDGYPTPSPWGGCIANPVGLLNGVTIVGGHGSMIVINAIQGGGDNPFVNVVKLKF